MLVKQDVFIWICPKCGESGGPCFDQSKMTDEELQYHCDESNNPYCPDCGAQMVAEV